MTIIYILLAIIIALILWLNLKAGKPTDDKTLADIKYRIDSFNFEVTRIETSVKNEIATNRAEFQKSSKDTRSELSDSLKSFEGKLNNLTTTIENKLKEFNDSNIKDARETRQELKGSLDFMREVIEKKLVELQAGNERKLEEMRITVDEKLQKTLETRLGESFKQVSERLEAVHKGLGDMQTLATGVGDLKRVLTNVKSRGVLGEYQLENLLEQLFTPDQYEKNVKTKVGSNAMVEFAIKMPGRNDTTVWLPIDSKFPKEDFEHLMNAYDREILNGLRSAEKALREA
jgi:DNA recombination protein RmuC